MNEGEWLQKNYLLLNDIENQNKQNNSTNKEIRFWVYKKLIVN